jgi:dihydrofolate reductase
MNAVIMGRKTWDSIPPKFRPLKGRLNIVISRSFTATGTADAIKPETEPVMAGSLEQALTYLRDREGCDVGRVFVIGGAQIYAAALTLKETKRVLLTKVMSEFECDTVFPIVLDEEGETTSGWAHKSKAELDAWTGETVPEGLQEESATSYEFQMWERIVD